MHMRRLVASFLLAGAVTGSAYAQTPHTLTGPLDDRTGQRGASAANAWIGAQLGYTLGDNSKELADNLLVSAAVIYMIPLSNRKLVLPVISNFANLFSSAEADAEGREDALRELMLASSGIRAGLHPYRKIESLSTSDFSFIAHGEASWKLNAFKVEGADSTNYLNQLRLGAGIEVAIGEVNNDQKPLTLSVTPVHTRFSAQEYAKVFGSSRESVNSLEVVAVVPVSARTGVLFEYVDGDVRSFRAGIVLAAAK
jgi:hypothetical protein